MLENGADIGFLQVVLGHSAKLKTTAVHTQVSIRNSRKSTPKTHPARKQHPSDGYLHESGILWAPTDRLDAERLAVWRRIGNVAEPAPGEETYGQRSRRFSAAEYGF